MMLMILIYCNMGFHPVTVFGKLDKNREKTAQKEKQYTKQYNSNTKRQNIQNVKQKYKTEKNKDNKKVSRVIRK